MIRLFLIALLFLVACEDKPAETIELSDLIEGVGEEDTTRLAIPKATYSDSMHPSLRILCDSLAVQLNDVLPLDTGLYLKQFQAKSKESWQLLDGRLHYFQFKDSLQSKNAFFNWLDCFGINCSPLGLWEEAKVSKQNEWVIVFEKEILYVQSDWYFQGEPLMNEQFLNKIEELKPKDRILFVLQMPALKKTIWWIKQDDKWIKRKKNEISQ